MRNAATRYFDLFMLMLSTFTFGLSAGVAISGKTRGEGLAAWAHDPVAWLSVVVMVLCVGLLREDRYRG